MGTGKSLRKVTQTVKNRKSPLHPKGRKAKLLSRATLRDKKLSLKKQIHNSKVADEFQIVAFFQEVVSMEESFKDRKSFTRDETKVFIETFITRDDEELEELKSERRPGRPASKRQDAIEMRRKQEQHMYETGWSVPDLSDEKNVEYLKEWKGDRGGLTTIKFILVKKNEPTDQMQD